METWNNESTGVNNQHRKTSKKKLTTHQKHIAAKRQRFKTNHMNKTKRNACEYSIQSKLKLAIATTNFPQEKLTKTLTKLIYNIWEEKSKQSHNKISRYLKNSTFVHGCLVFHNVNKRLKKWLESVILECNNNQKWHKLRGPTLCVTSYDKVKLIQVKVMIPTMGSAADIKNRLKVQNKELDSRNWTFLSCKDHTGGMTQCVFAITNNYLMKLKERRFVLYFGLRKVYASI